MNHFNQKVFGFTLIETMVVVAIGAILVVAATASYQNSIVKSRRNIGSIAILDALKRQEEHFINSKAYATNLTNLGYSANPFFVDQDGNETTSSESVYRIQLASGASSTAFTLEAVPQNAQSNDAKCATLQLSSIGSRNVTGTSSSSYCW